MSKWYIFYLTALGSLVFLAPRQVLMRCVTSLVVVVVDRSFTFVRCVSIPLKCENCPKETIKYPVGKVLLIMEILRPLHSILGKACLIFGCIVSTKRKSASYKERCGRCGARRISKEQNAIFDGLRGI